MKRETFNHKLAKAIRKARTEAGLTQAQLAARCGLTADWVGHFECERRTPDAFALCKLYGAFCQADVYYDPIKCLR